MEIYTYMYILFVPIIHRFWQVFQTTSCVRTELLQISSCWLANTCMSGVHRRTSLISSSLLLQQCPTYLVRLIEYFKGFILSDRSDFHMIDNLSIEVYAFTSCILMSFSVDVKVLPMYVNLSTYFREPPFTVEMSPYESYSKPRLPYRYKIGRSQSRATQKVPFSIATTPRCREDATLFPELLHLPLIHTL